MKPPREELCGPAGDDLLGLLISSKVGSILSCRQVLNPDGNLNVELSSKLWDGPLVHRLTADKAGQTFLSPSRRRGQCISGVY